MTTLLLLASLQVFSFSGSSPSSATTLAAADEDSKREPSVSETSPAFALPPTGIRIETEMIPAGRDIVRPDAETAGQAFPDLGRHPHDWLDPGIAR